MVSHTRIEHDSMGELEVPADAMWGAQTQRAVENFAISSLRLPGAFIRALALIKAAAAEANLALGLLDGERAAALIRAAMEVAHGQHHNQFPLDVFQTGSGTSSNMNANEVIAHLARRTGIDLHPNDHVNLGQSSNDVIPTAIQVSAAMQVKEQLLPALAQLRKVIDRKARQLATVVKTGRTHLMDAMPLTFAQELGGWSAQLGTAAERLVDASKRLHRLPLGGTAIGTSINAHPQFARRAVAALSRRTGLRLRNADNLFEGIAGQDAAVELSGQLNGLAVVLMKVSNDLRWMNSGPLAGLGEIELPALQPGSSIMPGKVNPVIPEAVCMVCAQVMGQHVTVSIAGQSGNFQLNTMLPLIAYSLLQSIELLSNGMRSLADHAIAGFEVRKDRVGATLNRNPILVTALNPLIGYERAAAVAKRAYAENRSVVDVAGEMTGMPLDDLRQLLDPMKLAMPKRARPKKR
ncbi:MAG: class II fumarate hydratase [Pseudomarimonas sp.]